MIGQHGLTVGFMVRLLCSTSALHRLHQPFPLPLRCVGAHIGAVRHAVSIPLDKLQLTFVRSSGPGGQNVNKLNTKAELRFNVHEADWIPPDIRARLAQQQAARINKEGELIITCQEHRTQGRNRDECIGKLKHMLHEASIEPKERNMWTDISDQGKEKRKMEKRHRSAIKQNRRKGDWD